MDRVTAVLGTAMTARQDTGSRTEADAAAFERRFGPDYDDRPTLSDLTEPGPDVMEEDEYEREYRDREEDLAWYESRPEPVDL